MTEPVQSRPDQPAAPATAAGAVVGNGPGAVISAPRQSTARSAADPFTVAANVAAPPASAQAAATDAAADTPLEAARAHAKAQAVAAQQAIALQQAQDRAAQAEPESASDRLSRRAAAAPDAPPPAGPDRPIRETSRLQIAGGIHVGQVVTWEIALLSVLAVHRAGWQVWLPVALIALCALVLTTVRKDGRWLYQWAGIGARYAARRRRSPILAASSTSSLPALLRGAQFDTAAVGDDEISVILHSQGVLAVLEPVEETDDLLRTSARRLPSFDELLPETGTGEPPISVQVIVQAIPAPHLSGLGDAAAVSYRELADGRVPAQRRTWIALTAAHTSDGHTLEDLRRSLANAVHRARRRLRKTGFTVRLLGRAETVDVLADAVNLTAGRVGADAVVHESWGSWVTDGVVHHSFRILDWPNVTTEQGSRLTDQLMLTPSLATTVGIAARRRGGEIEIESAVRVALPDARSAASAARDLAAAARSCGATLQRLDGEQVFGAAASMPLGGFAA